MLSTRGLCLDLSRFIGSWHEWKTEELCFCMSLPLHCDHGTQLGNGQHSSGYQLLTHIRVIIPANESQTVTPFLFSK